MPKVVTPLNLDFDEKEEFKREFGEGSLSKFVRQCIHERLVKQKNEKACAKDLSPIASVNLMNSNDTKDELKYKMKENLDKYFVYFQNNNDFETLQTVRPRLYKCLSLVDSRIATIKPKRHGRI